MADSVNGLLVRLDGLRDRPGFSTTVAVILGISIALLWGLGRWNQPEPVDLNIPSILDRTGSTETTAVAGSNPVAPTAVVGSSAAAAVLTGPTTGVSTTAAVPDSIIVHVSGAVIRQGLVELPDGSRLADAVQAAGGVTTEADVHRLNLATLLVDGMHIRVPEHGVADDAQVLPLVELPSTAGGGFSPDPSGSTSPGNDKINVNQATIAQLEGLSGVGPAIAAAIISWRNENGPFVTIDDLLAVPGIGPTKLAGMEDQVGL